MLNKKLNQLCEAIHNRHSMSAVYRSEARHFSPHAIAQGRYGEAVVLVYQHGGMSGGRTIQGVATGRCWRMFSIEELHTLALFSATWYTHESYRLTRDKMSAVSLAIELQQSKPNAMP